MTVCAKLGDAVLAAGAFLVPLLLLVTSCSDDERSAPPPAPRAVRVIEADPRSTELAAQASGRIQARYTSNVGFLVAGRLIAREVDLGAIVKPGDLLASLDPVDFQNKLVAAQSQVLAAQADIDQAAPQEARFRKLLVDGYATPAKYDEVLSALRSAQARMEATRANLRLAEDQVKYTRLLAPTAGAVTATGADPGQVVNAGQMVVQIARLDEREAVFSVSAQNAALAYPGMPVKVWVEGKPAELVDGSVREVAPNADPVTGTYTVKVALPHPSTDMRLGAVVVGRASVAGGGVVARIPATALLQTGARPQVWVVSQPESTVRKRPVEVLRYDADSVALSGGLNKGDLVVTAGVNSLSDGQKVRVQRASGS